MGPTTHDALRIYCYELLALACRWTAGWIWALGRSRWRQSGDLFFYAARLHSQYLFSGTWIITGHKSASRAIIASSYLFVCTFAVTVGPVSWTYPAEM